MPTRVGSSTRLSCSASASWGGYESLAVPHDPQPMRTATKWQAEGPLVRLHIGLEDPDDLIEDLAAALRRYAAA
jgi:cystathionine beta-lyase